MSKITLKINIYLMIKYTLLIYLYISRCFCSKQSVTLDTKLKVQDDNIEKIVKFRHWTTFKVKDSVNKRIGEVRHGTIVVMEDSDEDVIERVVYFKALKRIYERYMIKVLTKYKDYPHTVEYIIEDNDENKTCIKVIREQIDVDITKIDSSSIKSTSTQVGWYEYSMRNELNLQYRIGNLSDNGTEIINDSQDSNVRLRYFHVSKSRILDDLLRILVPCLPITDPIVVRVFTYYYKGERSFDEFVESYGGRSRRYIELIKQSIDLNLARLDARYFKKFRLDSQTFCYTIKDEYKHKKRIGNVLNNKFLVIYDDNDIRVRSVYTNREDTKFEHVEVKTCYRRGDCKKCKYILEDNKYVKSTCKTEKENPQDPGSSPNLFISNNELDKIDKKEDTYLNSVVSFNEKKSTDNDIIFDISDGNTTYFLIDILPVYNGIFYSLRKEYTGKKSYLKVFDGTTLLTNIHLEKAKEIEFIVKLDEDGEKRLFMWTKCGLELQKGHEVVVLDSLKRVAAYKTKKIEQKPNEIRKEPGEVRREPRETRMESGVIRREPRENRRELRESEEEGIEEFSIKIEKKPKEKEKKEKPKELIEIMVN